MYEHTPEPDGVRVTAPVALLRAGLERAVGAAGLRPATPGERAQILVHTDHTPPDDDVALDIDAAPDHVTLIVRRDPGAEAWGAVYTLVMQLLGA